VAEVQAAVQPKYASKIRNIRRVLVVAVTVVATAFGAAACSSHHHHPRHHKTGIGWY
jgi:hypothetical protein